MPFVVLKATDTANSYGSGKATIKKQQYEHCYIFTRYEHIPKSRLRPEDIKVYKDYQAGLGNAVTLSPVTSQYKSSSLLKAHVYYNKYDDKHNNPLLLILFFDANFNAKNRYYNRSTFDKDIIKRHNKGIDNLTPLEKGEIESQILKPLIEENDNLTDLFTYQVDKTTSKGLEKYNGNKINLSKHENDPGTGFTKYTHTPVDNHLKHKACVLYDNQVLLGLSSKGNPPKMEEISQTQYININSISAYYSSKIKEPLMIYINKQDNHNQEHLYYFQKKHGEMLFWQLFDTESSNEMVGERIDNDIHIKLTDYDNKLLLKALKKVETYLTKMLVILLDKKYDYSKSDVICSIGNQNSDKHKYRLANYANVSVNDVTYTKYKILSSKDFTVYEHDWTNTLKQFEDSEALKIKLNTSSTDCVSKEDILTINLDNKSDSAKYISKSHQIVVSSFTNNENKYIWYKHESVGKITKGKFRVLFGGKSLTFNGDLAQKSSNTVVLAYFKQDDLGMFVLLAFPNTDLTRIWFMKYSKFMESVFKGKEVCLSKLSQIEASTKLKSLDGARGYHIDESLLIELRKEYDILRTKGSTCVDLFDYKKGQKKFYVYLYSHYSRPVMICYDNKAYKPFDLSPKSDRWVIVDGISKCICNNSCEQKDQSDTKLLKSLSEAGIFLGLIDPVQTATHDDSENLLKVDISKKGSTEYATNRIKVSAKETYSKSDLFVYYTHTFATGSSVTIKSLIDGTQLSKIIILDKEVSNVNSVIVYFNKLVPDKPVILCIKTETGFYKYYKDLNNSGESYTIYEDSSISSDLFDKLVKESDRVNNRLTYQIDKITDKSNITTKYGNKSSITVSREEGTKEQFSIYTHKPTNSQTKQAFILYKGKLLQGLSSTKVEPIDDLQNKAYFEIKVYFLNVDKSLPLVIGLKNSNTKTTYYSHKKDSNGLYWKEESLAPNPNEKIKAKLYDLYYYMKSSVIIDVNKGGGTEGTKDTKYSVKLIENKLNYDGKSIVTTYINSKELLIPKDITVHQSSKIRESSKNYSSYNYVSHELSDSEPSTINDIAGIRLFITSKIGAHPEELQLYNVENNNRLSKDRINLYYPPFSSSNKIFVYFYAQDPRPLMICYDLKVYKRAKIEDNTKWVLDASVSSCSEATNLLEKLKIIYRQMRKKVTFVKNGDQKNITKSVGEPVGTFKRYTFTPKLELTSPDVEFKLPQSLLINPGSTPNSNIGKLLDVLNDKTFDGVNVYNIKDSKSLKEIFLLEFYNGSEKKHISRKDEDGQYWSDEQVKYSGDSGLQKELEKIQNNYKSTIVYEIDKQGNEYNKSVNLETKDEEPKNFTKYTHKPKKKQATSKAFVLYNGRKLMEKKHDKLEPIHEIQDLEYECVSVYFGKKSKNTPLVVEFNKSSDKTYYGHKMDGAQSYWVKIENSTINSLDKLSSELKKHEFDLVESLVVLTDKKNDSYGDVEISKAILDIKSTSKFITPKLTSKSIRVNDKTDVCGVCVSGYNFKVYEHDLSFYFKQDTSVGLRFFIFSGIANNKYCEIKLYNSDTVVDNLYYEKNGGEGKDKAYVYFYGTKDPRPLLVCYGGAAYKPKNTDTYFEKWYKDKNIGKCGCNQADDNQELLKALVEIVKLLNVVKLDQRPDEMTETSPNKPGKNFEKKLYEVHKYNGETPQIKVTYANKSCYRLYKHEPNGTDGQGEGYRLGKIKYELASQKHDGLEYKSHKPLTSVYVYYSVYDEKHENILLIALEFKGNDRNTDKEYYKLKRKDSKEWEKMDESGSDKDIINELKNDNTIEKGLNSLRTQIGIEFDKKKKTLFKPDECKEDNTDIGSIAGGAAGGIVGVGTIVTIGVVLVKRLGIAAFTTAAAAAAS